jgi:hypothetical protein
MAATLVNCETGTFGPGTTVQEAPFQCSVTCYGAQCGITGVWMS